MTGLLHEAPLPTVVETEVVRQLRQGRARIARGWCQGVFFKQAWQSSERYYCALGAIGFAGRNSRFQPGIKRTCELVLVAALQTFENSAVSVSAWNDAAGRTQDDVLKLYDKAIEMELAK